MEIKDIRRNNLRLLAKRYESQRNLADAADLSYAHLNNIIGKTPVRNCGEKLARKIEEVLNLPIGWLDTVRSNEISSSTLPDIPLVEIILLEQGFAYSSQQKQNFFSPQWALENKHNTEQIVVLEMLFDNMSPNIRMHDFLAIDLGCTNIANGSIYLFAMNGEIMLRRFTKQINNIKLTVDCYEQSLYPPIEISFHQISEIKIIGKIIALYRNFV